MDGFDALGQVRLTLFIDAFFSLSTILPEHIPFLIGWKYFFLCSNFFSTFITTPSTGENHYGNEPPRYPRPSSPQTRPSRSEDRWV